MKFKSLRFEDHAFFFQHKKRYENTLTLQPPRRRRQLGFRDKEV